MGKVTVTLSQETFDKLQLIAIPLIDDTDSVIGRLINYWNTNSPQDNTPNAQNPEEIKVWISARGEQFPVGLKLRSNYLGHTYEAEVTPTGIKFDGEIFDNPSSAGIAVKRKAGASRKAANTNGWSFWEMQNTQSGRWESINLLRYAK